LQPAARPIQAQRVSKGNPESGEGIAFAKVDDLNYLGSSLSLTNTNSRITGFPVKTRRLIVFPKRGAAIFTNKVAIAEGEFLFDSNLMGWQINSSNDTKYVAFCLMARRPDDLADVSTVPQINNKHIYPALFPCPPLKEQSTITDFLERETGKMDNLLIKKQALIEKLREKRTALISRTVTRGLPPEVARAAGLDPHPKLKPSGVEWLGDVPANWLVKRLGYMALLKSGDNITSEQIEVSGEFPVYGGNGLRGYYPDFTHNGEYVLIGRQGALCGNINYATGKFWASEHAVVVNPLSPFVTKWLGEVLRAMNLNQYSVSAAQPGLSVSAISALKVPVPHFKEQQNIALFLERETSKIDQLITKIETAIERLQEYRTALITAAVTGKIDVRGSVQ